MLYKGFPLGKARCLTYFSSLLSVSCPEKKHRQNQKQENIKMNNLVEIKSKAKNIFAEKDIKSINEFLLNHLEKIDITLHGEVLLFEAQRNRTLSDYEEGLLTKEEFNVHQNRLRKALGMFIDKLDFPKQKKKTLRISITIQLSTIILIVLILLLLGIGILIYVQSK